MNGVIKPSPEHITTAARPAPAPPETPESWPPPVAPSIGTAAAAHEDGPAPYRRDGWLARLLHWTEGLLVSWAQMRCPYCRSEAVADQWPDNRSWGERWLAPDTFLCADCGRRWATRSFWDDNLPW